MPFFPQAEYQCGPAALATVLVHAGRDVTPDMLAPQVYLPGRQGSLQLELIAATRRQDLLPYLLDESIDAIVASLRAGDPVLVLQNLGVPSLPTWHYAVVVGIDPDRKRVVLRSGTERRYSMRLGRFTQSWDWGGRWALVPVEPGAPPEWAQPERFLSAAAGLEEIGRLAPAESAYRAAVARWPEAHLAWLGLGTVAYRRGDRQSAVREWRRAAHLAPESVATLNNLATVYAELGCKALARKTAERAVAAAADGPLAAAASRTLEAVLTEPEGQCGIN